MIGYFAAYYPGHADPDEVIESVGLTDKAGARLRQLSGGQRRRVDVALGISGNPDLLTSVRISADHRHRRAGWQPTRLAGTAPP